MHSEPAPAKLEMYGATGGLRTARASSVPSQCPESNQEHQDERAAERQNGSSPRTQRLRCLDETYPDQVPQPGSNDAGADARVEDREKDIEQDDQDQQ